MEYVNLGRTGLKVSRIMPRVHDVRVARYGRAEAGAPGVGAQ